MWWLLTRPFSRVVIVAPEFSRQIKAVLFAELRRWVRQARGPLPIQVMSNRAIVEGHGDEWGIIGLPATEPDRIEGFHSEAGVLLILDESKGIPTAAYDALQGALTGRSENRLLVTSTHTLAATMERWSTGTSRSSSRVLNTAGITPLTAWTGGASSFQNDSA